MYFDHNNAKWDFVGAHMATHDHHKQANLFIGDTATQASK